jgi:hypothetical protein
MEKKTYKPYPDNGTLRATQSKKTPKSPDYWGNIAINLKDMTNIHSEDGLTVVKLSGWKKVGADGKTYLSISVDRFVPENASRSQPDTRTVESMDDDVPF